MAESSNASVANNVERRKDKKLEEAIAWKERPKITALRHKINQTRRKWEDLQQVGIEHDNSEVDHEDNLETIDYDTLHLAYDPESST
ncbi:hypothetical protein CTI12_AA423430 (mitochondrion) [Artemisia annua]|uniref:Uncharacterized protein n=1 Tax=Artemisia annua TaxID=35608 RepID=A0A2U1LGD4_ARTAN|nr:hypothetical protein CTI12_AA423430 [Artemisia annua]